MRTVTALMCRVLEVSFEMFYCCSKLVVPDCYEFLSKIFLGEEVNEVILVRVEL